MMMHTDAQAANRICPNCSKPLEKRPGETDMETAKRTFCNIKCYRQQGRKHTPARALTVYKKAPSRGTRL